MTRRTRIVPLAAVLLAAAPLALVAQSATPAPPKVAPKQEESQAALLKQAKITDAVARATALELVPGGVVKSHELEREDGKLIWSYDIAVAGKSGIEEIAVDAITGKVVAQEHETPADEKKEAAEDAAKAKAAKPAVKKP